MRVLRSLYYPKLAPCNTKLKIHLQYAWLAHFKGKLSNMDGRAPPSTRDGAIKWPSPSGPLSDMFARLNQIDVEIADVERLISSKIRPSSRP